MNKLTFEQISELINSDLFYKNDHDPYRWMLDEVYASGEPSSDSDEFNQEFQKLGRFKIVDEHGGEGQGDEYWTVYYFEDHDVYIQFYGWYSSYEGPEYEDMVEVEPTEVTITQYIKKRKT